MSPNYVIDLIRSEAERIATAIGKDFIWYIFGSFSREPKIAADIDLLIICHSHRQTQELRTALSGLCLELPIHLLLMTTEEAIETQFVSSQKCYEIFPTLRASILDKAP